MPDETADKSPPVSLPGWLSEKRMLVAWSVAFGILVLLTFFIFVPVALTVNDADGDCLLFADPYGFGPTSVCSFCVAMGVILLLIFAVRLCLLILEIINFSSNITDRISGWFNIWGVHLVVYIIDLILIALLLVTACLITDGFSQMCEDLFGGRSECSSEYGVQLPNDDVHDTYYGALSFAEGAAWFTFCYWLLIVALETFMLWKNGTIKQIVSGVIGRNRSTNEGHKNEPAKY